MSTHYAILDFALVTRFFFYNLTKKVINFLLDKKKKTFFFEFPLTSINIFKQDMSLSTYTRNSVNQ